MSQNLNFRGRKQVYRLQPGENRLLDILNGEIANADRILSHRHQSNAKTTSEANLFDEVLHNLGAKSPLGLDINGNIMKQRNPAESLIQQDSETMGEVECHTYEGDTEIENDTSDSEEKLAESEVLSNNKSSHSMNQNEILEVETEDSNQDVKKFVCLSPKTCFDIYGYQDEGSGTDGSHSIQEHEANFETIPTKLWNSTEPTNLTTESFNTCEVLPDNDLDETSKPVSQLESNDKSEEVQVQAPLKSILKNSGQTSQGCPLKNTSVSQSCCKNDRSYTVIPVLNEHIQPQLSATMEAHSITQEASEGASEQSTTEIVVSNVSSNITVIDALEKEKSPQERSDKLLWKELSGDGVQEGPQDFIDTTEFESKMFKSAYDCGAKLISAGVGLASMLMGSDEYDLEPREDNVLVNGYKIRCAGKALMMQGVFLNCDHHGLLPISGSADVDNSLVERQYRLRILVQLSQTPAEHDMQNEQRQRVMLSENQSKWTLYSGRLAHFGENLIEITTPSGISPKCIRHFHESNGKIIILAP